MKSIQIAAFFVIAVFYIAYALIDPTAKSKRSGYGIYETKQMSRSEKQSWYSNNRSHDTGRTVVRVNNTTAEYNIIADCKILVILL